MAGSQSIQEKRTLDAIWKAHPTVIAFTAAVTAHVAASDLTGLEAMNDTMRFASAWISAHGPLPDSGILCD